MRSQALRAGHYRPPDDCPLVVISKPGRFGPAAG
jgi:hypothetical protein